MTEIKLPPLPRLQVPRIDADIDLMDIRRLVKWAESIANTHARAAIEADRQTRGEPVAELEVTEDTRCVGKRIAIKQWDTEALSVGVHKVYTTPQPAEPEPCFCDRMYPDSNSGASCGDCPTRDYKKPDEPVNVPSDAAIEALAKQYDCHTSTGFKGFARALLASYGQPAQPKVPEPLKYGENWKDHYVTGWNNCRSAMLEAAPEPGSNP